MGLFLSKRGGNTPISNLPGLPKTQPASPEVEGVETYTLSKFKTGGLNPARVRVSASPAGRRKNKTQQ